MDLFELQKEIYTNKIAKKFNTKEVWKEIILLTEEVGELADADEIGERDKFVDAIGDIMVLCIGLCEMFELEASVLVKKERIEIRSVDMGVRMMAGRLGRFAKAFKHSNQKSVDKIDNKRELLTALINLMMVCSALSKSVNADLKQIVTDIVEKNRTRTHTGQMKK